MAPSPIVWGYVDIYRRKKYVGGASRGPRGRGPRPRTRALHPRGHASWLLLDGGSKSPGSYLMIKSRFLKVSFRLDSI